MTAPRPVASPKEDPPSPSEPHAPAKRLHIRTDNMLGITCLISVVKSDKVCVKHNRYNEVDEDLFVFAFWPCKSPHSCYDGTQETWKAIHNIYIMIYIKIDCGPHFRPRSRV